MKITQLELATRQLPALATFYAENLGLPILRQTESQADFQAGWTQLRFRASERPTVPVHFAFNVPYGSLDAYLSRFSLPYLDLNEPGRRTADFAGWRARASYFTDPDGNLVEFIERAEAGFFEPTVEAFQGISELGLAVRDVTETTARLVGDYGLTQFAKSQPMPDFNAVGDDHGLLILARNGRPWLFTDIPARAGQTTVRFTNQRGESHTLDADAFL